jgi:hypothetical protein
LSMNSPGGRGPPLRQPRNRTGMRRRTIGCPASGRRAHICARCRGG